MEFESLELRPSTVEIASSKTILTYRSKRLAGLLATLPVFFIDALSPGGIIISGSIDRGFNGIEPFWFLTGHLAFFKRR
jgi:hypothetical protein